MLYDVTKNYVIDLQKVNMKIKCVFIKMVKFKEGKF